MADEDWLNFHEMGLDDRLLKAIARLGWSKPTFIQEKAIPLALEGKDILLRARTGSGKTAAYAIPVIQKVLRVKQMDVDQQTSVLVMTPTKELCHQAFKNICELTSCCSQDVKCVDISRKEPLDAQKPLLMEKPDIVIGTPSRVLAHILADNLQLRLSLSMLVIDEADLVFSFGYEKDLKTIMTYLPQYYQAYLMSATLNDDVQAMKRMILHNPVILKLDESQLPETSQLTQYHIKCEEDDKFLLLYTLVKLGLIRGKTLIFVKSVDRCYKLKLFLEQFAIASAVLNSELPVNSRVHIVVQFNEGKYDLLIAADELTLMDPKVVKNSSKSKRKQDKESGVSRGIDFQLVSNVINFDFPPNTDAYIHRVGRTARGENEGTALSFVNAKEMPLLVAVEQDLTEDNADGASLFKPFNFRMSEIDGFRYRATDAMKAVTKLSIRDARLKEIRNELLSSQKLKTYFEDNPRDLQMLRHDKASNTVKIQEHLKNVPDYLVPPSLRHMKGGQTLPFERNRNTKRGAHTRNRGGRVSKGQKKFQKRKSDPLKSFQFSGIKKKKVPTATLR